MISADIWIILFYPLFNNQIYLSQIWITKHLS